VRGHVNIYLDGVDIRELGGVDTVVVPGATVHIIAAVSGG
jgi:molybdopterin converting factor small subunit